MARFETDAVLGRLEALDMLENPRESRRNAQHDLSRITGIISFVDFEISGVLLG